MLLAVPPEPRGVVATVLAEDAEIISQLTRLQGIVQLYGVSRFVV